MNGNTPKLGCEGIVEQAAWLNLSTRPVAALGQGQEPESACCHARGGGGLGALIKRLTKSTLLNVVIRKTLRRGSVSTFFANLRPCLGGMEASNGAHYCHAFLRSSVTRCA
jgi:hypothetical protein